MSLHLFLTNGDVGGKVVQLLNLHDMCRLYMSSKELKQESKVLVAHLNAPQSKIICDLRDVIPDQKGTGHILHQGASVAH